MPQIVQPDSRQLRALHEPGGETWQQWPIDPDQVSELDRSDAVMACALAGYLKLDHAGWLHAVWRANKLTGTPHFRRLVSEVTDELERTELLHANDLIRLMEETR